MSLALILTIAGVVGLLGIVQAARVWLAVLAVAVGGLMYTGTLKLNVSMHDPAKPSVTVRHGEPHRR